MAEAFWEIMTLAALQLLWTSGNFFLFIKMQFLFHSVAITIQRPRVVK
jgi:hypothetical protein